MLTPHPLALKLKLPNFNNKTLSEANASLFFYGSLPGDSHVALLLRMT